MTLRPSSQLCQLARSLRTVDASASGHPQRTARRAKNIAQGRLPEAYRRVALAAALM